MEELSNTLINVLRQVIRLLIMMQRKVNDELMPNGTKKGFRIFREENQNLIEIILCQLVR